MHGAGSRWHAAAPRPNGHSSQRAKERRLKKVTVYAALARTSKNRGLERCQGATLDARPALEKHGAGIKVHDVLRQIT